MRPPPRSDALRSKRTFGSSGLPENDGSSVCFQTAHADARFLDDVPDAGQGRPLCHAMGGHRRSPHRRAVIAADGRSSGHLAANLGASTARLGATLAVIHVMRAALFRAPSADVRAQLARLLGERAVAGDRIGAQPADCRALDAAGWTVIGALSAGHVRETDAARGCAVIAGLDAVHGAWL
jgi:hypothetical protein